MSFNSKILMELGEVFRDNGFTLIEERDSYVRFLSDAVEIVLVFNRREGMAYLFAGLGIASFEITNDIVRDVLGSNIKIELLPVPQFIANLVALFGSEGHRLLIGDKETYRQIALYVASKAHKYTEQLKMKSLLANANKAWSAKNYSAFVKWMDKIGWSNLSPVYQHKYEIAQKKQYDDE